MSLRTFANGGSLTSSSGGSGTPGTVAKFTTDGSTIGDSSITDDGTNIALTEPISGDVTLKKEQNHTVKVNASTTATTAGANLTVAAGGGNGAAGGLLTLSGGAANGTNKDGGTAQLDAGAPTGAGNAAINIGTTNAKTITVGHTGSTTDLTHGTLLLPDVGPGAGTIGGGGDVVESITLDDAGRVTAATTVSGSGGSFDFASAWWSLNDWYNQNSAGITVSAGNYTVGVVWRFTRACTITGVKLVYPDNTSRSVKISVWDSGAVQQATQTVTLDTAGPVTVTFDTPYSLPDSETYKDQTIGIRLTAGTDYIDGFIGNLSDMGIPLFDKTSGNVVGASLVLVNPSRYVTGDAMPASTSSGEEFMGEPVFTVP